MLAKHDLSRTKRPSCDKNWQGDGRLAATLSAQFKETIAQNWQIVRRRFGLRPRCQEELLATDNCDDHLATKGR